MKRTFLFASPVTVNTPAMRTAVWGVVITLIALLAATYASSALAQDVHRLVRLRATAPGTTNQFISFQGGMPGIQADSAAAVFHLVDLNRGELQTGDEILLLNNDGAYLQGAAVGLNVLRTPTGQACVSGAVPRSGDCNQLMVIELANASSGAIQSGSRVRLRVFGDPCNSPGMRSAGGFVDANMGTLRVVAPATPPDSTIFELIIDRITPFTVTQKISAPFGSPKHFNAGNLMDLDPHSPSKRDYLGGERTYDTHSGIDFGGMPVGFRTMKESGLSVLSVAPGTVVYIRQDREDRCNKNGCPVTSTYDNCKSENEVIIKHDDGTASVYAHLMKNSVPVSIGQRVECGTRIGRVGSSGGSDGPHLHFELRRPHNPDFWANFAGGEVSFPAFWDVSVPIDPYQAGVWAKFRNDTFRQSEDRKRIPVVTCKASAGLARIARDDDATVARAKWAKGYEFDACSVTADCGSGFWCGAQKVCVRRVQAGESCTNGNQCPAGHGCQAGICGVGPNCTNKCPASPHPDNCFVDAGGQCKKEFTVPVRRDCTLRAGRCLAPCFTDASGTCKIDGPDREIQRRNCSARCLP